MSLASVVLPFINAETHLKAAIESVLNQNHPDIELILIDDGSTDASHEIALGYINNRVCLVRQTKRGISHAINRGFDLARGQYIFLHAAQDVSLPHRLARSIEILQTRQVDIVTCRPRLIDDSESAVRHPSSPTGETAVGPHDMSDLLARLFYGETSICASATAFTRDCLIDIGRTHEGLQHLQGLDYWIRCAASHKRLHIDADPWLDHRTPDGAGVLRQDERLEREFAYLYRSMVDRIGDDQYRSLFAHGHGDKADIASAGTVPAFALKPLVYMRHSRPAVRQIGYEMLIAILEDNERCLAFGRHMSVTSSQMFEMLR